MTTLAVEGRRDVHEVIEPSHRSAAPRARWAAVLDRLTTIAPPIVWILAIGAGVLVVLATIDGAGISWDSIAYVQSGINLVDSHRYTGLGGGPITAFPPGMAMISGAFHILGIAPASGFRFLDAALAGVIIVLSWRLLVRIPAPPTFRVVAITFIAVSPVLLAVESMVWSEPLFIAITLGFLVLAGRVIERRELDWSSIVALSGLGWAAFGVRCIGLVLIPTGVVVLLVARWRPTRRDLTMVVAFAALSSIGPMVWMLRNRTVDGTLTGPRDVSTDSVGSILESVMSTIGRWADSATSLTRSDPTRFGVAVVIVLIGVFTAAVTIAIRRHDRAFATSIIPSAVFGIGYAAYLFAAKVTTFLDPIDTRLLSPIFVPLVVVTTAALARITTSVVPARESSRSSTISTISTILTGIAGIALAATLGFTIRDIARGDIRSMDFNTARWRDSELARATLSVVDGTDTRVTTNAVPGLWVATGLGRIIVMPLAIDWRGEIPTGEVAKFTRNVNCADVPLVLALYDEGSETTIPLEALGSIARFTAIGSFADGTIYRVEPHDGSPDRTMCRS